MATDLAARCNALLHTAIPAARIPGARFLALARDGSTLYYGGSGTRSILSDEPMTADTMFWIASCTKVLTAVCAMQCVERGLVTLDEDLGPRLPGLAQLQVRHAGVLVPRTGPVTLRQLLSMTSGLSYPGLDWATTIPFKTAATGTEPLLLRDESGYVGPFSSQPGTKWEYSGSIDWAGVLVETLTGLCLGDYLRKNVLEPCGVDEVTFDPSLAQRARIAGAHYRWRDGRVTARGALFGAGAAHLGGAGAYATVDAFARVLLPLVNGGRHPTTGRQVLQPDTVAEMLRGQLDAAQLPWLDQPTPANRGKGLRPGDAKQWGLGFLVTPEGTSSGRGAGAATWAGYANTHWLADPEKGVVMVVFAQLIPNEDEQLLAIRDKWEAVIYDTLAQGKHNVRLHMRSRY